MVLVMNLPDELQPLVIPEPAAPLRKFASEETVYLRFESQQEQRDVFASLGFPSEVWGSVSEDFYWPGVGDISIVGTIYNDDAVRGPDDENGMPTFTPPTAKPGWHVNVLPA